MANNSALFIGNWICKLLYRQAIQQNTVYHFVVYNTKTIVHDRIYNKYQFDNKNELLVLNCVRFALTLQKLGGISAIETSFIAFGLHDFCSQNSLNV